MSEKIIKADCLQCKQPTNHNILHDETKAYESEDGYYQAWVNYQVIQCRGCETVSFRMVSTDSESRDFETGEFDETVTLYPSRMKERAPMDGVHNFPVLPKRMYEEVIKAFNAAAPILTAIGLRALIESICLDCEAAGRNLEEKINALAGKGLLAVKQAEFLHAHRFLGNKAAHEIKAPRPIELTAALDIAETLLKTIYVLPETLTMIARPVVPPGGPTV